MSVLDRNTCRISESYQRLVSNIAWLVAASLQYFPARSHTNRTYTDIHGYMENGNGDLHGNSLHNIIIFGEVKKVMGDVHVIFLSFLITNHLLVYIIESILQSVTHECTDKQPRDEVLK